MSSTPDFTKLVPGFDFLQGLVKNAGSALPGIGQWVAPTLNPEELEKRISELRTVQYWLEQNGRMLGATIQALEVQRMTLSTLKTMNVQMDDLRDSLKIRMPQAAAPAPAAAAAATPTAADDPPKAAGQAKGAAATGAVDPMQWWGALTQQFSELASTAMKDGGADAARQFAGALAKQGFDTTSANTKGATTQPTGKATAAKTDTAPPAARKTAARKKPTTRR